VVSSHFLLAHYYYPESYPITATQKRRKAEEIMYPIFDHPGSLGHIAMSRQNPRHLQQTTTTTHKNK
jgi:hypothetical protein